MKNKGVDVRKHGNNPEWILPQEKHFLSSFLNQHKQHFMKKG